MDMKRERKLDPRRGQQEGRTEGQRISQRERRSSPCEGMGGLP